MAQKPRKLYSFKSTSARTKDRWVGEDKDGSLWVFPAVDDGWSKRVTLTSFKGRASGLSQVDPALARGTGWQGGAGGGRRRLGGDEVGEGKVIRAASTMWNRVADAAAKRKINATEYVRQAIDRQLERDRA